MTDLDCLCLDAEHAPYGRMELDQSLSIAAAKGMPTLVRVPDVSASTILNALDCGATGIVAPHITTREAAENLAKATKFGTGGRGYAGSTRAAGFGRKSMADTIKHNAQETVTIAQIEDVEALDVLDDIASVDGIDCLFVGRIDLTVALGAKSPTDQVVLDAVSKICAAGKKHGIPVGMFTPSMDEVSMWRAQGASFFLMSSDQSFVLNGANGLASNFNAAWDA